METVGIVLTAWYESMKKFIYKIFIQHPGKEGNLTIAVKNDGYSNFSPLLCKY